MDTDQEELRKRVHELDVTLWVGKGGLESVVSELDEQLANTDLVKVKFLRSSRNENSIEVNAVELADRVDGTVVETRGHTAVLHR